MQVAHRVRQRPHILRESSWLAVTWMPQILREVRAEHRRQPGRYLAADPGMGFAKILCPVDFSEPSRLALKTAASLAHDDNAELLVVHAWEAPLHPQYSELMLQNEMLAATRKAEEDALATFKREAEDLGAKRVRTKLLFGVPWHAIAEETREDPVIDLVVMGTHGRTGIKHVLLGSVAERVARHACCPVLLVRPKGSQDVQAVR